MSQKKNHPIVVSAYLFLCHHKFQSNFRVFQRNEISLLFVLFVILAWKLVAKNEILQRSGDKCTIIMIMEHLFFSSFLQQITNATKYAHPYLYISTLSMILTLQIKLLCVFYVHLKGRQYASRSDIIAISLITAMGTRLETCYCTSQESAKKSKKKKMFSASWTWS